MMNAAGYLRVSTKGQKHRGHGLAAQKAIIHSYCSFNGFNLVKVFIEVASGLDDDRPIVHKAVEFCRQLDIVLIVSAQSRLARSEFFISMLTKSKFRYESANMPNANTLQRHIQAAFDQHQAEETRSNTKRSLAEAVKKGVKLGGNPVKLKRTRKRKKRAYLKKVKLTIEREYKKFPTVQGLTDRLNRMRFTKLNGKRGNWHVSEVHGLLRDLNLIK